MIEQVLLVAGHPNAGKSYQLRGVFRDPRLGGRRLQPPRPPRHYYQVAPGRYVHVRLSSPHESKWTLKVLLERIRTITDRFPNANWLIGMATHISGNARMPVELGEVVSAVRESLHPGRIRVVVLSPDRLGHHVGKGAVAILDNLDGCDVHYIDAREDRGLQIARLLLD